MITVAFFFFYMNLDGQSPKVFYKNKRMTLRSERKLVN